VGLGQNTQRAGEGETPPLRRDTSLPLIDQNTVSRNRQCQADGCPFTGVKVNKRWIGGHIGINPADWLSMFVLGPARQRVVIRRQQLGE